MALLDLIKSALHSAARTLLREGTRATEKSLRSAARTQKNEQRATPIRSARPAQRGQDIFPTPGSEPVEWNVATLGLPRFEYRPDHDSAPDPGEVVWTWVPFAEHDGRGKDRPVLVVASHGEHVFFVQLTSKDHADHGLFHDRFGTWWLDIGSGAWDPKGRPSEAKLSTLWVVHESQIRRIGAALDPRMYRTVISALTKVL